MTPLEFLRAVLARVVAAREELGDRRILEQILEELELDLAAFLSEHEVRP
jgi:hypothetical protein